MGKSSKDSRDIYYRQAKSDGYRARSAYKLLHLDEEFGFLRKSPIAGASSARRRVVDLCAAPGSWSQVLSQRLPSGSKIVAVDLQPMAPLPGIVQVCGDITLQKTADEVSKALWSEEEVGAEGQGRTRADLVICDGAPDVTGLHALDAYLHSQLMLAALRITLRLLQPGGTFVAKIFCLPNPTVVDNGTGPSGADIAILLAQLRSRFESVVVSKPRSSRVGSAEHFVVAQGFREGSDEPTPFQICGDLEEWNQ